MRDFTQAQATVQQLDTALAGLRGNATRHDELVRTAGRQLEAEIALMQGDWNRALSRVDLQSDDRANVMLAARCLLYTSPSPRD